MPFQRTASFKSLMTFKVLYECGHATRAAQALGITQSGVSRSLALLEQQLQFPLFIREKNRLLATPEADNLYAELTRMTGALLELEQNIASIREYGSSRVRISATPALGLGYAPRLLAKAFAGNKNSNLVFDIQSSDEVVRAVESGFTDVGLVTLPVETALLQVQPLVQAQAVCLLPPQHPLCDQSEVHAKDFAHQHLVVVSEPNSAVESMASVLKKHGVKVLSRTECNIAAMHSFVASGMGIGIMNEITALEANSGAGTVVLRPFKPLKRYEFALVYRSEWAESRTIERLLQAAKVLREREK